MKVNVVVKPKEAVLDPQGGAVRDAMRHLGMPEVRSVRIGKFMEIDVDGEGVEVEKRLHGLCRELLSNPVIEDYEVRKPEDRSQTSDIRGQKSEVRHQRSEVRSQTSEVRGQKSEVRSQKSEIRGQSRGSKGSTLNAEDG